MEAEFSGFGHENGSISKSALCAILKNTYGFAI